MAQPVTQNPITTAAEWKARATQGGPLELPSGSVCLARNPGMPAFMQAGIIPNPLLGPIQQALAMGKEVADFKDMVAEDPSRMNSILELMDNVVQYCVLQPPVYDKYEEVVDEEGKTIRRLIPQGARDPDKMYIDDVDPEDKVFIMQWASGGSSDLVKFRRELGADMAAVFGGQNPAGSTAKRASRPAPTKRTNAARPRKAAGTRKR